MRRLSGGSSGSQTTAVRCFSGDMHARVISSSRTRRGKLSAEEIGFFVQGAVARSIPEYQVSAWLMPRSSRAGLRGAGRADSRDDGFGRTIRSIRCAGCQGGQTQYRGVGDKVLADPRAAAACAGVRVPMVSAAAWDIQAGRSTNSNPSPVRRAPVRKPRVGQAPRAGITRTLPASNSFHRFKPSLRHHRTSDNFVPADKIFYSLRDVTGTIETFR